MATASGARGPGPERAWAPSLPLQGQVVLDRDESAHLVRVRRVQAGEPVVLFDGAGTTRIGSLTTADPKGAVVTVHGAHPARVPARTVRIAASLPEPARADQMIATLAELGVADFVPLRCARTDSRRDALLERRRARWERACREALKVNGGAHVMGVHAPRDLADLLGEPCLVLDPDPQARPFLAVLEDADPTPWILVGPEGGFTEAEVTRWKQAGMPAARLGASALRTATAACAAAAAALLQS